jgi:Ca2+-binding RTX toxin-like protein
MTSGMSRTTCRPNRCNTANALYGNAGNNLLNGASDADRMLGGAGNDTNFVDNAGDLMFENANEGTNAVFASVNHGLTANMEAMVLHCVSSATVRSDVQNDATHWQVNFNGGSPHEIITFSNGATIPCDRLPVLVT